MARDRQEQRSRASKSRDGGRFLSLPHAVVSSAAYRALPHAARSLLIDIACGYMGSNNGQLVACAKYLHPLGWNSADTITRNLRMLLDHGLLWEARKGARPNKAAWFAVTWLALDYNRSMDFQPTQFPRGAYNNFVAPSHGVGKQRIAPSHGVRGMPATPSHGAIRAKNANSLHRPTARI
jgi:hypothetical protein